MPTPNKDILIDVQVFTEDDGYMLCNSFGNNIYRGDFCFDNIELAEQTAFEGFGIQESDWVD